MPKIFKPKMCLLLMREKAGGGGGACFTSRSGEVLGRLSPMVLTSRCSLEADHIIFRMGTRDQSVEIVPDERSNSRVYLEMRAHGLH